MVHTVGPLPTGAGTRTSSELARIGSQTDHARSTHPAREVPKSTGNVFLPAVTCPVSGSFYCAPRVATPVGFSYRRKYHWGKPVASFDYPYLSGYHRAV